MDGLPVDLRDEYMEALEGTSVDKDIMPFGKFVAGLVQASIDGNPIAK